ncbi:MAG: type II toxin-antitoxin system VapC family toxin [Terriglobia bacterium]
MPVFLDTNIFLYAAGGPHPQKSACVKILQRVADGSFDATSNTEVVQEILFVLTRRGRASDAVKLARGVAALFPNLLPVTRDDMLRACDLIARQERLSVRDAVHAATMLNNGVSIVVSVDSDFDHIPGLRRVVPASA